MKKDNHLAYYFFFSTIMILGLILVAYLGPNRNFQMAALVGLSIVYALIGILHHLINHDLVGKIVLEYVFVALLGIAASFFIFRGGFGI